MHSGSQTVSWRLLAPIVVFSLVASAMLVAARAPQPEPGGRVSDAVETSARDYYYTLAAPRVQIRRFGRHSVDRNANDGVDAYGPLTDLQAWWQQQQRKHSQGFPRAAEGLAQAEAQAVATGQNPRAIKVAKQTQRPDC